jgi:hypothetical protein
LEIVLILMSFWKHLIVLLGECTIGSNVVLDAPDGTPR